MVGAAALLLAACGGSKEPRGADKRAAAPKSDDEAAPLAAEVRELADRLADYIGSHRNTVPAKLGDLGVDSLTPETARVLVVTDSPRIEVTWRRPGARRVLACTGGPAVLEEALLKSGEFSLRCRTAAGDTLITAHE